MDRIHEEEEKKKKKMMMMMKEVEEVEEDPRSLYRRTNRMSEMMKSV